MFRMEILLSVNYAFTNLSIEQFVEWPDNSQFRHIYSVYISRNLVTVTCIIVNRSSPKSIIIQRVRIIRSEVFLVWVVGGIFEGLILYGKIYMEIFILQIFIVFDSSA